MINRNISPKTKKIDNIRFQTPKIGKLDNNINYYGFNSNSAPVIKLDLIFKAGVEFQQKALQSVLANSLLKEAPKGKTTYETSEFFDYYGSYVEAFSGAEIAGLRLFVPVEYFEKVMPVFADLVKNPLLPIPEYEIMTKKYSESIKNNFKKTKYVAMRGLNLQIFGKDHQLGYFVQPEDAESMAYEDVVKFVKQNYVAENCKFLISGSFDDTIISNLNTYFGSNIDGEDWNKAFKSNFTQKVDGLMEKNKTYEFPDAVQSSIYGGIRLDLNSDEDMINMDIVNTVFGGYFGSHLMKNIREDKGYTYGIGSYIAEYSNSCVLRIVTDVGVDVTKKTVSEIYKEIDKMRIKKVSLSGLKLVKNYMLGELLSSLDGVISTSMVYEKLLAKGRSEDYIKRNVELINSITPDIIKDYAEKYLIPENFSFVVAGKYN
jgi:predicted Zn-dependent peptidase